MLTLSRVIALSGTKEKGMKCSDTRRLERGSPGERRERERERERE
jgi:hypothetical protein